MEIRNKSKMKTGLRIFIPFMIALLLDGLTKVWAIQALSSPTPILGNFFRLTLGYNTGVAFGLFANGGIFPLIVTGSIIAILAAWLFFTIRSGDLSSTTLWPLGMILGGAVANFADRMVDGRVTDFLDFGLGTARWPTFNMADSFIVVGALLLLLIIPKVKSDEKEQTA
jgi:signal peptidase II